jgi:amino acid adenylation domain-containing protein/thioester reductase-like protein
MTNLEFIKDTEKNLVFDLSEQQKSLWFIHSLDGYAKVAYNESIVYSLNGYVSFATLDQAFKSLVNRHAALRTSFFCDEEGHPKQYLSNTAEFDLKEIVFGNKDISRLQDDINDEITLPFDLTKAPLIRATLIKLSEFQSLLVIVQHHIITDGTSIKNLINELSLIYNQLLKEGDLSPCEDEQAFFKKLESKSAINQEKIAQLAELLRNYESLNLLTTPNTDISDPFIGDRVYFNLDHKLASRVFEFCKSNKITVFNFLYSVYLIFLSKYTRNEDLVIGIPFVNRVNQEERQALGYFANTLPVRINFDKQESFLQLVSKAGQTILSYLTKQEVPFEYVGPLLGYERKISSQHPLIQTFFAFSNASDLNFNLSGVESKLQLENHPKFAKFDLSLFASKLSDEQISAYFEYRSSLFEHGMIEKFAEYFITISKSVLDNPYQSISSISMLDELQLNWMKKELFTADLTRVVTTSLPDLFRESARLFGDRIALTCHDRVMSYTELDQQSDKFASYLRNQYQQTYNDEMSRDTRIGICFDRHEDMIISILGILKSEASYVPVDPRHPQDRMDYILSDSDVSFLITQKQHLTLFPNMTNSQLIILDDPQTLSEINSVTKPIDHTIAPSEVAYVLYTSGSTGKPKGVLVTHENVVCLFESLKRVMSFSNADIWSLFHTYCFDISVWEIWGALLFGGKLVIVPYAATQDPFLFYQLLLNEQVTVLTQTPSAFQMLITEDLQHSVKLANLRYVGMVGESLKVSILKPWVEKYGVQHPLIVNLYGITETTVYTNYKFIDHHDIARGRDNIGKPLNEFSMCVMSDDLTWSPIGIVGEIHIGGRGLSKGYLNRPDLTAEKFIIDPYSNFLELSSESKLYRTGDLGRWLEDGSIEYLGRKDFQVKLRGYRIELGEIEAALGSYPGISQVVVLLKGEGDLAHLVAYFMTKPGYEIELTAVNAYLKSFIPSYMVPQFYMEIQELPMTPNGKVDRRALEQLTPKTVSPRNKVAKTNAESEVAEIWSEILDLPSSKIEPFSNFFELGGNSLSAVRMLHLLSKKFVKELSISQFIAKPDLRSLTKQMHDDNSYSQMVQAFCQRIRSDAILSTDIMPVKSENSSKSGAVLLTGATGFLGAHILHELLQRSTSTIYCLVRASSESTALEKIKDKLVKYRLDSIGELSRVVAILGDLDKKRLGIAAKPYEMVLREVDEIYHVGANVNHLFDYASLYNINVRSTVEILKIATRGCNKTVHYVSTIGAQPIEPLKQLERAPQGSQEALENSNGYLCSKWVSERLIEQAAQRGVRAYIYRPGNIVLGKEGIDEPDENHILLRLKGILQLKKVFLSEHDCLEMMPVDLLASTIVNLATAPKQLTYNLHNKLTLTWKEYIGLAQEFGYQVETVTESQWSAILDNLCEDNAFFKLTLLYRNIKPRQECQAIDPDYEIIMQPYHDVVRQQLTSLIIRGFLPQP